MLYCEGGEEDVTLMIRSACKKITEDYDLSHEMSKKVVEMASAIMQRLINPTACDTNGTMQR